MKLAPVLRALEQEQVLTTRIVHTGQHYDAAMSGIFFSELGIRHPDVDLGVGSGLHGAQTARILERYEHLLLTESPRATVVFGDVNSTLACGLAAVKLGVPLVHVEAGLRSFDRTMPEEVNRVLTDAMADLLLVSEPSGIENLRREGISGARVKLVGNVMIDSLVSELAQARQLGLAGGLGLVPRGYALVTMHRPSNVDDAGTLDGLLRLLHKLAGLLPLVFPVHPRTAAAAASFGLEGLLLPSRGFLPLGPLSYRENLSLMSEARVVLTDSGGMQEESTFLGVPCLTLRSNTERPVTVESGTSRLVGNDPERIHAAFLDAIEGRWKASEAIPLWDGMAGPRISQAIAEWIGSHASGRL